MRISDWSSDVCSFRSFGRDADMALAEPRRRAAFWPRERQAAMADAEIDGGIKLAVSIFVDDVRPDDAELRRAMRDEGRDIEGAHADQRDVRLVCPRSEEHRLNSRH